MPMLVLALLILLAAAGPAPAAAPPELKTDEQKILYVLGVVVGRNLSAFNLSAAELELVQQGLADVVLRHETRVPIETYASRLGEFQKTRLAATAAAERKAGQALAARLASEKNTTRTASGLIITTLKDGTGARPTATDQVRVHYHGTLTDGTVFDSSVQRGDPVVFPLNAVIPCWSEGLQLMKVGGKSRLVCPADLAYGDRGAPPLIKPGATLVFEVELLEIGRK